MPFNPNYPPRSDVVFTVMFLDKTLCEMTLAAVLGEKIELVDIVAEFKNDLQKAAQNSIYFDIKTRATDGRIITLDLQRSYNQKRLHNRIVYYACREVAGQSVEHSQYEDLKNVLVTFILTEAPLKSTAASSKIQLIDNATGQTYSDLLTLYEINLRHIGPQSTAEMQILRQFFTATTAAEYHQFLANYGDTPLGSKLNQCYEKAVREPTLLDKMTEEEEKYMFKLTDEEREWIERKSSAEGRLEGRLEGVKEGVWQVAENMLEEQYPIDAIARLTKLPAQEIMARKQAMQQGNRPYL